MKILITLLTVALFAFHLQAQTEGDSLKTAKSKQNDISHSLTPVDKALQEAMEEINRSKQEMKEKLQAIQQQMKDSIAVDLQKELTKKLDQIKHSLESLEQTESTLNKAKENISKADTQAPVISEGDTFSLRFGDKKLVIISDKKSKTHDEEQNDKKEQSKKDKGKNKEKEKNKYWAGIEAGVAGYAGPSNTLSPPRFFEFLELDYTRSANLSINFLEKDIKLYKEYVKLVSGFGLSVNSYAFEKNIVLAPDLNIIGAVTDSSVHFNKNKLKITWLTLPVMIGFSSDEHPKKAFHLSGGVVLGYKIGSKTKQKYTIGDQQYKPKVKSDYNLLPYHYSVRIGLGYAGFNLYATYAFSNLFKTGEGPEMHPFTIGVSIMGL